MKNFHKVMNCIGIICLFGAGKVAKAADSGTPYSLKAAYESLSLPAGESMGMA